MAYWIDVKKFVALHPEVRERPHKITFSKTQDILRSDRADALKCVFDPDCAQTEAAYRQQIIERFGKLTLAWLKNRFATEVGVTGARHQQLLQSGKTPTPENAPIRS